MPKVKARRQNPEESESQFKQSEWADTSWSENERAWRGGTNKDSLRHSERNSAADFELLNRQRVPCPSASDRLSASFPWPTTSKRSPPTSSRSTPAFPSWSGSLLALLAVLALLPWGGESRTILNAGNPDAKRLYDDLLSNYNKLVRPVVNTTDPLTVRIKLKLSQLIDVVSLVCHLHVGISFFCSSKVLLDFRLGK